MTDPYMTSDRCIGWSKTLLCCFIVMVYNNMYRYEHHFGSFYRNPTILETVSIASTILSGSTPTEASKIHCQIAGWRTGIPAMVTLMIQLNCFTVHYTTPVAEHICAQSFRMWNRPRFHPFLQVSQIFQRRKSEVKFHMQD